MGSFALIHGGGSSGWDWHLVVERLAGSGHDAVAVDLPIDDPSAGWWDYADAVVDALDGRRDPVVVGHSLGGFTAPLVCARTQVSQLILVAAMIPRPGELFSGWWGEVAHETSGEEDVFFHDVRPELVAEAQGRSRPESSRALQEPWPLEAWPTVTTRALLCRDDRMFPAAWARGHVEQRLGIEPDWIDGGHYIALARPRELADRLASYVDAPRTTTA